MTVLLNLKNLNYTFNKLWSLSGTCKKGFKGNLYLKLNLKQATYEWLLHDQYAGGDIQVVRVFAAQLVGLEVKAERLVDAILSLVLRNKLVYNQLYTQTKPTHTFKVVKTIRKPCLVIL